MSLRDMVNIVQDVAVGQEGKLGPGEEEASIEEETTQEGTGVRLVDEENVVLDVLSLKEGMQELEEGGEMLLPGPEWD